MTDSGHRWDLTVVKDFTVNGWAVPERAAERTRSYCERLEQGEILFFERTPFSIPEEHRHFLLSVRQSGSRFYKNIAYRPDRDHILGFARKEVDAERLRSILRAYSQSATRFIFQLLSPYAERTVVDFASFRPIEEHGRPLSAAARNDLIHVDAFPTRPTNGKRILRVFTNISPAEPRVWITTGSFEGLARQFGQPAGLAKVASDAAGHRRWHPLLALARRFGVPLLDRSPYDRFMLGFHDFLKANREFQQGCPKSRLEFPPGSTWIVFTDAVAHAVMAGRFALEQTFLVPVDALVAPGRAPLKILEALSGAALTC